MMDGGLTVRKNPYGKTNIHLETAMKQIVEKCKTLHARHFLIHMARVVKSLDYTYDMTMVTRNAHKILSEKTT
jgi:hypothetical protein